MIERVIPTNGSGNELVGVVTEPEGAADEPRPALLFLNAGFLHRVGPHRLHVELARAVAAKGWLACRFDLSGHGDSPAAEDEGEATDVVGRALREVRATMDRLEGAYGTCAFVLFGICSGADHALRAAAVDPRVKGCVLVNGALVDEEQLAASSAASRERTQWRYYLSRAGNWRSLTRLLTFRTDYRRLVTTIHGVLSRGVGARPARARGGEGGFTLAPLLARGVRVMLVYSDGSPYFDVFESLVRPRVEGPGGQGAVRIEVLRQVDHVFTPLWSQQRLGALVCDWLRAGQY